jgi:hypothetical protein
MSDPLDNQELERKQTRRGWKLIITVFTLLLGGLTAFILLYDCAPPEDADMLPVVSYLADEENPLAILINRIEPSLIEDYEASVKEDDSFYSKSVQEFLAEHPECSEMFREFMEGDLAKTQWPLLKDFKFSSSAEPQRRCQAFANVIKHDIRNKVQIGKHDEALQANLDLINLGQILEKSGGALIHLLVAMTAKHIGLAQLEHTLTSRQGLTATEIEEIIPFVQFSELQSNTFQTTCKYEYKLTKDVLNDFKNGKADLSSLSLSATTKMALTFLKPNMMLNQRFDYERYLQKGYAASWSLGHRASHEINDKIRQSQENWFQHYVSLNFVGNITNAMTMTASHNIATRCVESVSKQRQIACILALRCYELDKRKLPEKLSDLVPEYIQSVLLDPFDNAPMRWNNSTGLLYSIGKDLIDGGGSVSRKPKSSDPDYGMYYWWGEKAAEIRAEVTAPVMKDAPADERKKLPSSATSR